MRFFRSRTAASLAALAAVTMTATPVMARDHWRPRHHRGGPDGGDVLAGLLVIGGIAAIATAASKSSERRQASAPADGRYIPDGEAYDQDNDPSGAAPRYRYPGGPEVGSPEDRDYAQAPDANPDEADFDKGRDVNPDTGADWREDGSAEAREPSGAGWGAAVDACTDAVGNDGARIDSVQTVRRMGERTSVEGSLADGRRYACSVDASGSVRSATIDGRGMI